MWWFLPMAPLYRKEDLKSKDNLDCIARPCRKGDGVGVRKKEICKKDVMGSRKKINIEAKRKGRKERKYSWL